MSLLLSLAISLIATLLIETAAAVLLKKRGLGLVVILAVNLLTNPVVVLLWRLNPEFPLLLLCMEVGAVLIEGCCYRLFPAHFRRPFLFSLLCNLLSFLIGGIL